MQIFSLLLYNLFINLSGFGIWLASFFNAKAKLWIEGRRNQKGIELRKSVRGEKRVWIHCASLGEFEQARPVIEKIKENHPKSFIILTFFSPSGYEIRKNYNYADAVLYLPLDTVDNAIAFIEEIKPDLALFVKYEFWYHFLTVLKTRKIPVVLFSAIFRKEQIFFKWYGGFFRTILSCFNKIFVQNKESQQLLSNISIQSEMSFDTRFDRVWQIAQSPKNFPAVEKFKGNSNMLLAGSTWKKDEDLLTTMISKGTLKTLKYMIAPHNLGGHEISDLEKRIKLQQPVPPLNTIRLSQLTLENASSFDIIIVDTMGDLSALYKYADIAYVGGAFNASVHNVLEPAVYGVPVIFGPKYLKSAEAKELRKLSAAFPVSDKQQLQAIVTGFYNNTGLMKDASVKAKQYVIQRLGGVNDIYSYVSRYL